MNPADDVRAGFAPSATRWLDHAATTPRPRRVVEAVARFSREENASVRRGLYREAEAATARFEAVRAETAAFVGALSPREIVFTHGTTEGINLVAAGLARRELAPGDEVWATAMEHHANFLPWQRAAAEAGARFRVAPLTPEGRLDLAALRAGLAGSRAKWVAVAWVSNVLGVENPVAEIAAVAHTAGARVLVDGAQGVAHAAADVAAWDCDFFAFSAHKAYGPMGVGALWGKAELLARTEPLLVGGEMVRRVRDDGAEWAGVPRRFEAGTQDAAGVIGWGEAMAWWRELPKEARANGDRLARAAAARLRALDGVRVAGPDEGRRGLVSFAVEGIHAHDVAQFLAGRNIAVRAGRMCAHPLMERLGEAALVRASFGVGNTDEDVDALLDGVRAAREYFG